jgi:hypothetical protein
MSYDVWLEIDTGGKYPARVSETYSPTYNLGPMFQLALGLGLRELTGASALVALPILRNAIAAMESGPERFKALNPPNGWGNYEVALEFLKLFLADCEQHPKATVHI